MKITKLQYGSKTYEINSDRELEFKDLTVSWGTNSDNETKSAYPYVGSITASGVTSNHSADVRFSFTQIDQGIYAPVSNTAANKVYIYATENPGTITIPVIVCTRIV